jgi:uncharacterized protein
MGPQEIETRIQNTIQKHLSSDGVFIFLFGSRASGTSRPGSDYDVGVFTGKKIPWATIGKIRGELEELPVAADIDIVDFASVSNEFKAVALKGAKIWHRPKTDLKLI